MKIRWIRDPQKGDLPQWYDDDARWGFNIKVSFAERGLSKFEDMCTVMPGVLPPFIDIQSCDCEGLFCSSSSTASLP